MGRMRNDQACRRDGTRTGEAMRHALAESGGSLGVGEQHLHDRVPFRLGAGRRRLTTRAGIPVVGIGEIAFGAVQIGMHPSPSSLCAISCALFQSPFAAHHSARSGGGMAFGGSRSRKLCRKASGVMLSPLPRGPNCSRSLKSAFCRVPQASWAVPIRRVRSQRS
jgi:hypothetical protein